MPMILGDSIEGEAREVARVFAGIARSVIGHGAPIAPPCVLLSGGETTVTMRGNGRGGRNAEFLLALALEMGEDSRVSAIACDTDGIDGSETNAGAWFEAELAVALQAQGIDLLRFLDRQRRLHGFRSARSSGCHRSDADQRQRFPVHPHSAGIGPAINLNSRGKVTRTVVPLRSSLSIRSSPPCKDRMWRARLKPRPVPGRCRALVPRKNGWLDKGQVVARNADSRILDDNADDFAP